MLIRPTEQDVANYWYLHVKGWEINLTKMQGPSTLVKILGLKWYGHAKILHLRQRISCCSGPSNNQNCGTTPSGSICILGITYSSCDVFLLPIYWVIWKGASFECGSEQERTSLVPQTVKSLSAVQETRVLSLGRKDPLEKEMATHSSILAWKIPWMKEPGRLQSMGSQRVWHDWATSVSE